MRRLRTPVNLPLCAPVDKSLGALGFHKRDELGIAVDLCISVRYALSLDLEDELGDRACLCKFYDLRMKVARDRCAGANTP